MDTDFGKWLREQIKSKGWKQVDLVRATGLTRQAIGNYINLNRIPDKYAMKKLACALNLPVHALYQAAGLISQPSKTIILWKWQNMIDRLSDENREQLYDFAEVMLRRQERNHRG